MVYHEHHQIENLLHPGRVKLVPVLYQQEVLPSIIPGLHLLKTVVVYAGDLGR